MVVVVGVLGPGLGPTHESSCLDPGLGLDLGQLVLGHALEYEPGVCTWA